MFNMDSKGNQLFLQFCRVIFLITHYQQEFYKNMKDLRLVIRLLLLINILIISTLNLNAQYSLSGKIVTEAGQAVQVGNVVLLSPKNSSLI